MVGGSIVFNLNTILLMVWVQIAIFLEKQWKQDDIKVAFTLVTNDVLKKLFLKKKKEKKKS